MPVTRPGGRDIRDGSLTDIDMNPANVDGLVAVPSLRTLGTGAQQAAPGDSPGLALNDKFFLHSQLSVSFGPRFYVCGQARANGGTPNNAIPVDTLYFMPLIATTNFTLRAVGLANTNAPAGTTFNYGIYDSVGPQDLQPNNLIAQLGVTALNAFPTPFQITGLALPLAANQVYWLAVVFGVNSPNSRTLNTASAIPILGHSSTMGGAAGIGHRVAFPIGPLPNPAPATTVITNNGTPFLAYGI